MKGAAFVVVLQVVLERRGDVDQWHLLDVRVLLGDRLSQLIRGINLPVVRRVDVGQGANAVACCWKETWAPFIICGSSTAQKTGWLVEVLL
jgi:hypothetical protein